MKRKNWKEIRSALVMSLVMVSMLSTATYAWFSLTSSPTVTGLQMTASSTGGLKISADNTASSYVDAISLAPGQGETPKTLLPATVDKSSKVFSKPVYTGNEVTSVEALTDLSGYVAEYDFYLKTEAGQGTVDVGIIAADTTANGFDPSQSGVTDGKQSVLAGSFVAGDPSSTATEEAVYAVRIGIVVDNTMYIYEPNSDGTLGTSTTTSAAEASDVTSAKPVSDVKSTKAGVIDGTSPASSTSPLLFQVGETAVPVKMYIWLEGTDEQCVDQIQLDKFFAQVQFTIVE